MFADTGPVTSVRSFNVLYWMYHFCGPGSIQNFSNFTILFGLEPTVVLVGPLIPKVETVQRRALYFYLAEIGKSSSFPQL